MRYCPDAYIHSLDGSRDGDSITADIWRDGEVLVPGAFLSSWSFDVDMDRQIRTQGTLVIEDVDGSLAPWAPEHALGPAGSHAVLKFSSPDTETNFAIGEYVITSSVPRHHWSARRVSKSVRSDGQPLMDTKVVWMLSSTITVQIADMTYDATLQPFPAPTPATSTTVISEIQNLIGGMLPVRVSPAVSDKTMPKGYVHDGNPLSACEELLKMLGATHRVSYQGEFEILPDIPVSAPVWNLSVGESGVMVDMSFTFTREELVNYVIVTGKDLDGNVVAGSASITSGPLSIYGANGVILEKWDSDLITSNQQALDTASAILYSRNSARSTDIPIECAAHFGLEGHDVVTITLPIGAINTPIRRISWSGGAEGVGQMSITGIGYLDDIRQMWKTGVER